MLIPLNSLCYYMLLYADDIVIFSKNAEELQVGLDVLVNYFNRWKLKVKDYGFQKRWCTSQKSKVLL